MARIPELLAGRYRLGAPIGVGGMGQVFRAHDELLDRPVAVKLLERAQAEAGTWAEARAAATVVHPGIVHVFDVGIEDGLGYIVMELASGQPLRDILRSRGPLPWFEACRLVAQVADALDAMHINGLVHCDVKPLNIIVSPSGQTKLVDFGIARAADGGLPHTDEIHGSAAYVAPEQALGQAVDGRSDVYALAVVLYETLTGRLPFDGTDPVEIVKRRMFEKPVAARMVDPRIPLGVDAVVMRGMEREPASRYRTVAEMRDALRSILACSSESASAPTQKIRVGRSMRPPPVRAMAAIVLGLAVIGGATAGWTISHAGSSSVPKVVGVRLSDLPTVLEDAGVAPADARIIIRPVDPQYVGTVVDQQPQPGLPRKDGDELQIAVGVSE